MILCCATVAASFGVQSTLDSAGTHGTAAEAIGSGAAMVAHGVEMLLEVADAAWQATVRELAKVIRAVLDWHVWASELSVYLGGGVDVFHP